MTVEMGILSVGLFQEIEDKWIVVCDFSGTGKNNTTQKFVNSYKAGAFNNFILVLEVWSQ